ncbi:uncharacterized protein LOC752558 [Strongylocentrotus purpuratus]|uniref:Protein quiver n=1 Tax=Strongylocentrotus purpuratus TaxID=7668 RepID=A0A7M7G990_STRPU|nr:uncharacterized protein LOC752558 [Strongylocentrotus purpuratus]|eukprot:XP_001176679.2 PREDICTED: uncharacterized protein LOC752558 [Strongylocentrotus purpuratus]
MTTMNAQVLLLVAVLSFGIVQAQQCYNCLSITSDGDMSAFPSLEEAGFAPCDENYEQSTMDCSASGGCLKANYNFVYDIQGQGNVATEFVIRTCGAAADVCETASRAAINAQRDVINAMLPDTIQFVSGSGAACVCSGNLCNRAHTTTLSLGALIASLLVSYLSMKR